MVPDIDSAIRLVPETIGLQPKLSKRTDLTIGTTPTYHGTDAVSMQYKSLDVVL